VPSFARDRLRALGVVLVAVLVIGVAVVVDARGRAATARSEREQNASIVRATGLSELALSTSSTWLRHPTLSPPSAGASDAPLGLDVDPAGAVIPRHGRERAIVLDREVP
jgi:hypothetical protein